MPATVRTQLQHRDCHAQRDARQQCALATANAYTAPEGSPFTVARAGVLGNDSDPDGDTLDVVTYTLPVTGTLIVSATGALAYVRRRSISAITFTYRATGWVHAVQRGPGHHRGDTC